MLFKYFLPSSLWLQGSLLFQITHCDCESIASFSFLILKASLSFSSPPWCVGSGTHKKMKKQKHLCRQPCSNGCCYESQGHSTKTVTQREIKLSRVNTPKASDHSQEAAWHRDVGIWFLSSTWNREGKLFHVRNERLTPVPNAGSWHRNPGA